MQSTPMYKAIASSLLEEIKNGRYVSGLPSEADICLQFGVSRITARGALKQLTDDGIIYVIPGKGSFPVLKAHMTPVYTAVNDDLPFAFTGKEQVSVCIKRPDIYQVYEFHIHPDSSILTLTSRLFAGEEVIGIEIISLPHSPYIKLTDENGDPRDLDSIVASSITFDYSFDKQVFISGQTVPFRYTAVNELGGDFAVLYEVRYVGQDKEVYARREIYVKPGHFTLDAKAGGDFDER